MEIVSLGVKSGSYWKEEMFAEKERGILIFCRMVEKGFRYVVAGFFF